MREDDMKEQHGSVVDRTALRGRFFGLGLGVESLREDLYLHSLATEQALPASFENYNNHIYFVLALSIAAKKFSGNRNFKPECG
jgi:hypothetical protein